MSIINEALKKTEAQLKKNSNQPGPLPHKPSGPKSFIIYILILLLGLLLANFIFTVLKKKIQTVQTPKNEVLPVIPVTIPAPLPVLPSQPPEEKKPTAADFVLNGIFFSDNDGYALINNQIVRVNDYVDKAKVSAITANSVELNNAGEIITLSTRR